MSLSQTLRSALFALAVVSVLPLALTPTWAQAQSFSQTEALDQIGISNSTVAPAQPAASTAAAPLLASAVSPSTALPDDPSVSLNAVANSGNNAAALAGEGQTPPQIRRAERAASLHMKYIPPGWSVTRPLPAKDKMLLGLKDLYNPLNFAAMFASAGYEQVLNGEPNYGVDRGAFGERLGAAAIRESTQGLFTDTVFSPLLREDPRYYVEGPQYGFVHRTLYAITRPLVTRTDSGRASINGALLLGYAASSALSYTYYPQINKNFHDTASTFGGGLGGAALGFVVSEFSSDVLQKLHHTGQP